MLASPPANGLKRHSRLPLVTFRTEKPEGESPCVVVTARPVSAAGDLGSDSERAFAARLLPSPPLHNHPHYDADHLSQAFCSSRMLRGEESIDGIERLELAHNTRQGGTVVVDFRVLHSLLAMSVVEEREDLIKWLLRVVKHIREGSALSVLKKILSSDLNLRHLASLLREFLGQSSHLTCRYKICTCKSYQTCRTITIVNPKDTSLEWRRRQLTSAVAQLFDQRT